MWISAPQIYLFSPFVPIIHKWEALKKFEENEADVAIKLLSICISSFFQYLNDSDWFFLTVSLYKIQGVKLSTRTWHNDLERGSNIILQSDSNITRLLLRDTNTVGRHCKYSTSDNELL